MTLDRLRIYLFGEPRFELGGTGFRFSAPPKTLPLLAYLLLHRRGAVARETLAALLWPDADQTAAYTNLRRHLHYLTKALPAAPESASWVLTTKTSIAWNGESPYWLDVEAFETELQERHLRGHAVRLYSGDLYERCSEEWIDFERERLRTLQISNLAQLCADAQKRSSYVEALQYAQLMLAADPWREDALRTIMETRMLLGDRAGAMAEYERFAARLQAELNTKPLDETAHVYRDIARSAAAPAAQQAGGDTRAATMIGRRNELATLRAQWQRAARGEGCAVFIGGEAGIGKTTLLGALCDAAAESGATVLAGAASPHEDAGYGALIAPAQAVGVDLVTPAANEEARLRTFEAFAGALETRARAAPLLIAVEDLHWAGTATLELLRYLILRLSNAPVLFAATYREFEVRLGHQLRIMRRQLGKMRRATNVALSALSREDVHELAALHGARTLSDELVRRIYERSDGNPLFVSEIVRELQRPGGAAEIVPSSIAEIVGDRLERLPARTRGFLQTAAVASPGLSAELLVRVTGVREAEALEMLDELVASHFLRENSGDTFSFAHEIIREAVYDAIAPETARLTHGRVAFALRALHGEQFDDVAATAARHFELAGIEDAALEAYQAAAQHALDVYAIDEARAFARRALEHARGDRDLFTALQVLESAAASRGDRGAQREVLEQLVKVAERLGAAERAAAALRHVDFCAGELPQVEREALERLKALAEETPEHRAAYLLREGEHLSRIGRMREAIPVLQDALCLLSGGGDADALLRCLAALYVAALSTGDRLDAIDEHIGAARARLGHRADERLSARLAFIQSAALVDREPAAAMEYSERMLEHARSAGDMWLETLAHRSCGACATRLMQLGRAREHLRVCADRTIAAGRLRDVARVRSWQVMLENRCGNFPAAEAYGADGLEAARACGAIDLVTSLSSNLSNTAVWAGDLDAAERRVREALRLGTEHGYAHPSLWSLLGEILIGKGDLRAGLQTIERAWEASSPQEDALGTLRVHVPLLLGLAYLAGGREADARACADRIRGELGAFESYYIHPQVYLWSASQLLRLLDFAADARGFSDRAQRRRDEIRGTLGDEPSREIFDAFVFNEFVADDVCVDDPLHAWFLPYEALKISAV